MYLRKVILNQLDSSAMNTKIIMKTLGLFLFFFLQVGIGAVYSQSVRIFSLNNSLIDYNNQPEMFNELVKSMGKDARWSARTQLGRTLLYHYNDGISRQLALSDNWDYIVLQEQSALPRLCPEILMESVELWKCALLNVSSQNQPTIILPMNWAYSDNWAQFNESSEQLKRSYLNVCREIPGVVVCPVGLAYKILFDTQGEKACATLYTDNRHPSLKASYLAACMEYAVIFGEAPSTITYIPEGLSETEAREMRLLADKALSEWNRELKISR